MTTYGSIRDYAALCECRYQEHYDANERFVTIRCYLTSSDQRYSITRKCVLPTAFARGPVWALPKYTETEAAYARDELYSRVFVGAGPGPGYEGHVPTPRAPDPAARSWSFRP